MKKYIHLLLHLLVMIKRRLQTVQTAIFIFHQFIFYIQTLGMDRKCSAPNWDSF